MSRDRLRAVIPTSVAAIVVTLMASSAMAQSASQSGDTAAGPPVARPKHKPINLEIEAPSLDFMQDITKISTIFTTSTAGSKKNYVVTTIFTIP